MSSKSYTYKNINPQTGFIHSFPKLETTNMCFISLKDVKKKCGTPILGELFCDNKINGLLSHMENS